MTALKSAREALESVKESLTIIRQTMPKESIAHGVVMGAFIGVGDQTDKALAEIASAQAEETEAVRLLREALPHVEARFDDLARKKADTEAISKLGFTIFDFLARLDAKNGGGT